jgi:hypothetical protein
MIYWVLSSCVNTQPYIISVHVCLVKVALEESVLE